MRKRTSKSGLSPISVKAEGPRHSPGFFFVSAATMRHGASWRVMAPFGAGQIDRSSRSCRIEAAARATAIILRKVSAGKRSWPQPRQLPKNTAPRRRSSKARRASDARLAGRRPDPRSAVCRLLNPGVLRGAWHLAGTVFPPLQVGPRPRCDEGLEPHPDLARERGALAENDGTTDAPHRAGRRRMKNGPAPQGEFRPISHSPPKWKEP